MSFARLGFISEFVVEAVPIDHPVKEIGLIVLDWILYSNFGVVCLSFVDYEGVIVVDYGWKTEGRNRKSQMVIIL